MSELDIVCISRRGGHTHPGDERVYVTSLRGDLSACGATSDRSEATRMPRPVAQSAIDRGRWHGLDPEIEVLTAVRLRDAEDAR